MKNAYILPVNILYAAVKIRCSSVTCVSGKIGSSKIR